MKKKNNFFPKTIRFISYTGCILVLLCVIFSIYNNIEYANIGPILNIDNIMLRAFLVAIFLTITGFNLIMYTMSCSKIEFGITDKYLSIAFGSLGISLLFFQVGFEKVALNIILGLLLGVSYLANLKIYKNNEYNKFIDKQCKRVE